MWCKETVRIKLHPSAPLGAHFRKLIDESSRIPLHLCSSALPSVRAGLPAVWRAAILPTAHPSRRGGRNLRSEPAPWQQAVQSDPDTDLATFAAQDC